MIVRLNTPPKDVSMDLLLKNKQFKAKMASLSPGVKVSSIGYCVLFASLLICLVVNYAFTPPPTLKTIIIVV